MKIIQSFWSNPTFENSLHNRAGWLSAEYHWMSWALSVLTLREFYDDIELVTDRVGKSIIMDLLQLPYTSVRTEFDQALISYPPELWALAKIYSYSIQKEPFLHIDGDVFIWEAFPLSFHNAPLIAQNYEIDFPFYYETFTYLKDFGHIPECMSKRMNLRPLASCNTGIIGGTRLDIFHEYKQLAFEFINRNRSHITSKNIKTLNIGFEQFLYYCLAQKYDVCIDYYISQDTPFQPEYSGFARFESVPYQTKFIHALGDFKRQQETCRHLARRLRQDYPAYYYRIIEVCKAAGVALDCRYYQQMPIPSVGSKPTGGSNGSSINSPKETYRLHYEQDVRQYRTMQTLFSLPLEEFLRQKLQFSEEVQLIENTNQEGTLEQTLIVLDIYTLAEKSIGLDPLNMVLLDAFLEESISIQEAIERVAPYFKVEEVSAEKEKFRQLVSDRIKELMYWGVLMNEKL